MNEIDRLIEEVKTKRMDTLASRRAAELEKRRNEVFRRLAYAAKEWEIDVGVLRNRLREASIVRISHAESMAKLAERCGDFSSLTFFWEIQSYPVYRGGRYSPEEEKEKTGDGVFWYEYSKISPQSKPSIMLWSGHVLAKRLFRLRWQGSWQGRELELDVNTRQVCEDGSYVASCHERGGGIAIGVSTGNDASPIRAAYLAVIAAFQKYSEAVELPSDLEQRLTVHPECATDF